MRPGKGAAARRKAGRPSLAGSPMRMVAIRFPGDLLTRLEAYVEVLRRERPGSAVGLSDAIRALIIESLTKRRL